MKIPRVVLPAAVGALVWLGGCASIGPPMPPSLELPKQPADLRAARKGDEVTLTWTIPVKTTDRQSVRYLGKTNICRTLDPARDTAFKECEKPIGHAAPPAHFPVANQPATQKLTASFTDTLPSAMEQEHPTGSITYAIEVLNTAEHGAGLSNQVHVPLVPTLAPFGAFSAELSAQGVTITWKCAPAAGRIPGVKYLFRIYRHSESSPGTTRIAELDAVGCAAGQPNGVASFLDQTFEWESTYLYRGTVVSVLGTPGKPAIEIEGDDTPEVKVFAHDIFPPGVPSGLQAVFSGPGQAAFIDLIWAPVPDADLAGYNVYRHEESGAAAKVNSELVKTPTYRDAQVVSGKTYFYSVSAVDQRGNESAKSEEASERVP